MSHSKLLFKLTQTNLDRTIIALIEHWLKDRTQTILINETYSKQCPVSSGVPQGSVLSPFLFLNFINDMPAAFKTSRLRLFADGALLYSQIESASNCANLQADLELLIDWADKWQIQFNITICETTFFVSLMRAPFSQISYERPTTNLCQSL